MADKEPARFSREGRWGREGREMVAEGVPSLGDRLALGLWRC